VRVIPGSHHCGDTYADCLQEQASKSVETWGVAPEQVPCAVVETQPGDIIVFWHNTKHAAFGGSQRRRMYTMNFYEHVPDERLEDFQNALANEGRFWIDHILGETMLQTAGPERMVHLQQVVQYLRQKRGEKGSQ